MSNVIEPLSSDLSQLFVKTERHEQLLRLAAPLAESFRQNMQQIDEEAVFPFEHFERLKETNYLALTVPERYGGQELSLYELILIQERLSQGDASTGLCAGWHLGLVYDIRERNTWNPRTFEWLCREIVQRKAVINRLATEEATGSPTRGGKPITTAMKRDGKWILTGRKSFASMAEALDYSLVTATIVDTGKVGFFLVDHRLNGIRIESTWDMIAMRGTRSDDVIFDQVELPADSLVELDQLEFVKGGGSRAWLLHIPACYLGAAIAARNYAISFASRYQPNSLSEPIIHLAHVRQKIAEMDIELFKARHFLYFVAERWDTLPEKRPFMDRELAAAKYIALNSANRVVDLAMRIAGAKSLQRSNPLQQYYRDVRAGLHNPPMDDAVLELFASQAINRIATDSSLSSTI
ncbi:MULTISPECIES: acyl-CoA dehydrogenase family protein [Geobacillus]|uniref:acyl-CoA dehydrogenase family protein n=1 Tax=Geobacillus TaxID=129337 RepID=UPI00017E6F30|nr:acyl-CoA dehydrogenase family protein [Geobacillus sp. MR]